MIALRSALPPPVRRAVRAVRTRLDDLQAAVFERWLGVSVAAHEHLPEHLVEGRVHYEGSHWLPTRAVLRSLRPGPRDVLCDLGSGKGQVLLLAGQLPFARVSGVELSEELTRVARRNVAAARPRLRAKEIEVVAGDVAAWEPDDRLSVLYLYNPFTGGLLHAALERLFASYDRMPRPLHLVYGLPWEHNWLMGTRRVALVDVRAAQWPAPPGWWRSGMVFCVYRVVGPGEGGPGAGRLRPRAVRPAGAAALWDGPNDVIARFADAAAAG